MRLNEKEKPTDLKQLLLEERKRIGEELHSGAAASLSHALFLLNISEQKGKKEDLERARQAIKMAINEIRYAIHELREEEPWPLVSSIRDCVSEFKERVRIPVRFLVDGDDGKVPSKVRNYLLTLVQEGLNNVSKHSKATACEVVLKIVSDGIVATIHDNGTGFKEDSKQEGARHFGLKFMRERALQMGGELQVISAKGKGTTLSAHIPFLPEP